MLNLYAILIIVLVSGCQKNNDFKFTEDKINGFSVVAPPREIDEAVFVNIKQKNANWISLMPYAFLKKRRS